MVYCPKKPLKGKMDSQYVGPFEILEINNGRHAAKIGKDGAEKVVPMDHLKHAHDLPKPPIPTIGD